MQFKKIALSLFAALALATAAPVQAGFGDSIKRYQDVFIIGGIVCAVCAFFIWRANTNQQSQMHNKTNQSNTLKSVQNCLDADAQQIQISVQDALVKSLQEIERLEAQCKQENSGDINKVEGYLSTATQYLSNLNAIQTYQLSDGPIKDQLVKQKGHYRNRITNVQDACKDFLSPDEDAAGIGEMPEYTHAV